MEEIVIGYCFYCLNSICEHDTYVIRDEEKYHKDCFDLQFPKGDECGEPR